ncbi:uncharacterized protein LOC119274821 [Triticum dicoccoides]|uniref:uncharacterized protein LOC119274821 n=1 Tax=Triticum dicoccoides TaxID=85692 RepID=UPI00188FDB61|nr:uncharacterized protein LOC119274821 [Triticum dicoccoides]
MGRKKGAAGGAKSVALPVPAQTEVGVEKEAKKAAPRKRNPCPGIRAVGGRIYDPENGKTCHQCRQKTTDFAVACKQPGGKGPCSTHFCHTCLFNRYGEDAKKAAKKARWACPKCRGICNCSFCRKKKGETPTGILAHAAKATGHSSVHELLKQGSDMVAAAQTLTSLPAKIKKEQKRALETDDDADGIVVQGDENVGTDLNAFPSSPASKKLKKGTSDESNDVHKTKLELPRGTPVTNVVGAKLEDDDVGSAIQFYEFCRTFAEVFQIKKGQPEKVLQVITGGGRKGRVVPSVVADLHISLLSLIQEDRGENPLDYSKDGDAWITETGKYISESTVISKELPIDCLNEGVSGYKKLSPSLKLHVLNFLCDETLSTATLRGLIVKQDEGATERKIAAREKIRAAKEKEKELKERLKNEMDKSMFLRKGEEIKSLISQIKELNEDKEAAVDDEKLGDLLRTKPVRKDRGVAYWKFDGYYKKTSIMRQEFDTTGNNDKWFMFTEEDEKVIGDHLAPRSQLQCKSHTQA